MKLYLSVITVSAALIFAANMLFGVAPWYYTAISIAWCIALQFTLDGLIAIIINKLPDRLFGVDNPLYRISDWERKLYNRLGVRAWKDKIWELGGLGGFSKRSLKEPNNPEYVEKFIIECNKGVLTHRLSYPIGFAAMLTLPGVPMLSIALPVAAVNLFLNVLPTVALRHNTPILKSLLKRLKRKKLAANNK